MKKTGGGFSHIEGFAAKDLCCVYIRVRCLTASLPLSCNLLPEKRGSWMVNSLTSSLSDRPNVMQGNKKNQVKYSMQSWAHFATPARRSSTHSMHGTRKRMKNVLF